MLGESLADYEPFSHDPTLAASAPHHEHIPPDIKNRRIPAPHISFDRPNIPVLIEELAQLEPDQEPERP